MKRNFLFPEIYLFAWRTLDEERDTTLNACLINMIILDYLSFPLRPEAGGKQSLGSQNTFCILHFLLLTVLFLS